MKSRFSSVGQADHPGRGLVVICVGVVIGALLLTVIDDTGGDAVDTSAVASTAVAAPTSEAPATTTAVATTTSATTTTGAFSTNRAQISLGSKGSDVTALQQRLIALGFPLGASDGVFGTGTRDAVVAFQRQRGLPADGVVGAGTWQALAS
jgi:peptidoglycan hydrolase-like protein with peptidoglycan-binding domain